MNRVQLDLRGLPPPQPMLMILESLGEVELEATLVREPVPMYRMLEERGYEHEVVRDEPGRCVVLFRRRTA